jgi:ferredoxin
MSSKKQHSLMLKMMSRMLGMIQGWERRAVQMPNSYKAVLDSPVRFEIMKEGLKRGNSGMEPELVRIMPGIMLGMRTSMTSLGKNPPQPQLRVPAGFLADLQAYALAQGASSIGYTQVPEKWIFQGHAILHLNAIMLTMEMDKVRIDTAPSVACKQAVMEIYRDLGFVANRIARYLRKRGYSADAGHPLMGPAVYTPLSQMAGLGWLGRSGLLITPEHGPRVRLAAVFTNIENLPFSTHNDHAWIADFCAKCGQCIRKCPTQAIYETPIHHKTGRVTCIDNDRCFPYFSDEHGCSVCIKVCPFNKTPYEKIKAGFLKS